MQEEPWGRHGALVCREIAAYDLANPVVSTNALCKAGTLSVFGPEICFIQEVFGASGGTIASTALSYTMPTGLTVNLTGQGVRQGIRHQRVE